jgi:transcriptional regulator with XRE-family HTH domain
MTKGVKTPLEIRAAKMKARMLRKSEPEGIPVYWADKDVRQARLRVLCEYMGLTHTEFASKLGVSLSFLDKVIHGKRPCPMPMLKLAEVIYRAFIQQMKRDRAKEALEVVKLELPDIATIDQAIRIAIFKLHARGKSQEEIAAELAISPDKVEACITALH